MLDRRPAGVWVGTGDQAPDPSGGGVCAVGMAPPPDPPAVWCVLDESVLHRPAGIEGTFNVLTFPPELVGDPGIAYVESRIGGT